MRLRLCPFLQREREESQRQEYRRAAVEGAGPDISSDHFWGQVRYFSSTTQLMA